MTRFTNLQDATWINWTTTPSTNPEEIWVDIAFPRGLYKQEAGDPKTNHLVAYEVEIQALLDSDNSQTYGEVYARSFTRNMNSVDRSQYTEIFNIDSMALETLGPSPAFQFNRQNKYRVRVRRAVEPAREFSDENTLIQDDMIWASLRASKEITAPDFGDVTLVELKLTGSAQIADLEDRTFNVVAQRWLPDYRTTETADSITTRQWAAGFIYRALATDGGNFAYADIDVTGLYALNDNILTAIDSGDGSHLDLTLDRFEDTNKELTMLAAVVRAVAYRVGEKLFVVRDQKQITEAVSLYNRRNKAPKAELLDMEFTGKDAYDGIEFEFQDEAHDWKTLTFVYPDDSPETNLKRMKLIGITSWATAWRRAAYEWNLYLRRKDSLSLEVLEDPRVLSPLDKIKNVDNLDVRGLTDGEVSQYNAASLEVTLDKDVTFESGETYTVWIRGDKIDGEEAVESFVATIGGAANVITLGAAPTLITLVGRDSTTEGMGSLYSFAADSSDRAQDYLVMGYELTEDGFTSLSCVKYDDVIYDGDTATLPSPPDPPE